MGSSLPMMFMFAALVLFVCTVLKKVSLRIGIPSLLAFIVLGMVFGSDGLLKIEFSDYHLAETVSTAALAIIMFYGGFGRSPGRWRRSRSCSRAWARS